MPNFIELESTINKLAAKGKGILAADESTPTITKRFEAVGIESTDETRRIYRELLMTTPNCNQYIAGVILFEETLNQKTSKGIPFPEALKSLGILPGIKVDKGLIHLANAGTDQITQGLDGLPERLIEYKSRAPVCQMACSLCDIKHNTVEISYQNQCRSIGSLCCYLSGARHSSHR